MGVEADRRAVLRELLVVLVLAAAGIVLALLAAFTPWYAALVDADGRDVVELNSPPAPATSLAANN